MNAVKRIRDEIPPTLKRYLRKIVNFFIPGESIGKSKNKWNHLAEKNSSYYIMTDFGKNISEEQFRISGKQDYENLIKNDSIIKKELEPFSNRRVLEIGCGTGRITEFVANDFGQVTGLDISEKMIEIGKERLATIRNLEMIATDGKNYPLDNSLFDLVFSFIVFQHMPDIKTIRKNFEEITRVLKSNGIAKIQLRGLPTSKKNWFYGPDFDQRNAKKLIANLPLEIIQVTGVGQRYFWLWLQKKSS